MRIRNFGAGTPKLNEGIITSGSAATDFHAVYASGSIQAEKLFLDDIQPTLEFKEEGIDRAEILINDSDNLVITNQSTNKFIVFKTNDAGNVREGFRIGGTVPEVVVNEGSDSLIDFRVESDNNTHMLFVDGGKDTILVGADSTTAGDANFFVSGSARSRGTAARGTAVFGGDLVVSGTLTAVQKHICTAKYTADNSNREFIRFNAAGSNGTPSVNNKFVAPSAGNLSYIMIRSTGTPGQTSIGFHRATDLGTTPIDTQNIVMSSADTTYQVYFAQAANFGPGDIVGLSVDPTANHGNVDITLVFELDFVL